MKLRNLREARMCRGLRQADLARAAGLARQTIVSAERGDQVSLETFARLCFVLATLSVLPGATEITPEAAVAELVPA